MPGKATFQFHTRGIQEWPGRYNRIPGELSVFRVVRSGGRHVVQAFIQTSEGKMICEALQSQAVEKLIATINIVKRRYNRQPGGSFLLNEYGQVLVPTQTGQRFFVGQTAGIMLLRNIDNQGIVDLSDDAGLKTGDPWEMPYVGTIYHLSQRSYLYYWDRTTQRSIWPRLQDEDLIHKIRSVRRSGSVRLVVNPYEFANAFAPIEGHYGLEYVFLKRIDLASWFPKPEIVQEETAATESGTLFD